MFIKSAGFKKLIKEAYNHNGLRIGNDGQGIYICGGYWAIWVRKGYIPKKELAAIIELTGEMPDEGAGFKSGRAGNQYEMLENVFFEVMKNAEACERCANVTTLLINTQLGAKQRVIQDPDTNRIYLINEKFIEMLDNTCISQKDGEIEAEGPLLGPLDGIFWKNNMMALHVMRQESREKELIAYLEGTRITRDKEKTWNE